MLIFAFVLLHLIYYGFAFLSRAEFHDSGEIAVMPWDSCDYETIGISLSCPGDEGACIIGNPFVMFCKGFQLVEWIIIIIAAAMILISLIKRRKRKGK